MLLVTHNVYKAAPKDNLLYLSNHRITQSLAADSNYGINLSKKYLNTEIITNTTEIKKKLANQ